MCGDGICRYIPRSQQNNSYPAVDNPHLTYNRNISFSRGLIKSRFSHHGAHQATPLSGRLSVSGGLCGKLTELCDNIHNLPNPLRRRPYPRFLHPRALPLRIHPPRRMAHLSRHPRFHGAPRRAHAQRHILYAIFLKSSSRQLPAIYLGYQKTLAEERLSAEKAEIKQVAKTSGGWHGAEESA